MELQKTIPWQEWAFLLIFTLFMLIMNNSRSCLAQDYDVGDIQCSFSSQGSNVADLITARLKKPVGFKGSPLFADDRIVNPETDRHCMIKRDHSDPTELSYDLKINDFTKCGVLKRNGFVHVRIWFPQFPGVVMQSDQELIIMCKPPEPTIIENKAAGFAGSFPHGARVSGVVEETPGRLEYEVALYKEAPPIARISGTNSPLNSKEATGMTSNSELPVDQAVPIGTKLQLRARISAMSVWKYVKLMEVTVSPDPDDPHASGAVSLVHDGCRNRDFASIIPHQPARYRDRPNEVFLDFEAFLLSSMKERATLWIHSQIKACMDPADCQPDFCMDLFEPSGHGRRKRRDLETTMSTILERNSTTTGMRRLRKEKNSFTRMKLNRTIGTTTTTELSKNREETDENGDPIDFTKFKENIEYTVVMPGELDDVRLDPENNHCKNYIVVSSFLGLFLSISIAFICTLAMRLQTEHRSKLDSLTSGCKGYAGRAIVQ